jgi:exosome complex component RRP43
METATFAKIHPKEFYRKFLEQDVRPDGRGLSSARPTVLACGPIPSADGSALAKVGNTTVICGLKLEIGVPHAVAPNDGRLTVAVHLSPLCSPKFTVGKASNESVALSELLQQQVLASRMFDLSQLCLRQGASVWVIYADIQCLNYDGNVIDAALAALVGALGTLRLPETEIAEDGEVFVTGNEAKASLLVLNHLLVAHSFAAIDSFVVADPNAAEEDVASAGWTVLYNNRQQLCCVYKPGGAAVSAEVMQQSLRISKQHAQQVVPIFLSELGSSQASLQLLPAS